MGEEEKNIKIYIQDDSNGCIVDITDHLQGKPEIEQPAPDELRSRLQELSGKEIEMTFTPSPELETYIRKIHRDWYARNRAVVVMASLTTLN